MGLPQREMQSLAAAVLCNLSGNKSICEAIATANAIPMLIKLLVSEVDDIQSRAAIILADLASMDENQTAISDAGGIEPLISLLDSELEDVLVRFVWGGVCRVRTFFQLDERKCNKIVKHPWNIYQ